MTTSLRKKTPADPDTTLAGTALTRGCRPFASSLACKGGHLAGPKRDCALGREQMGQGEGRRKHDELANGSANSRSGQLWMRPDETAEGVQATPGNRR